MDGNFQAGQTGNLSWIDVLLIIKQGTYVILEEKLDRNLGTSLVVN